jgi:predicted RNA polymerase sigma factor
VNRTAWGVLENQEDAEDVLHTVFLRLLRTGLPTEFEKNPRAYLYRAAVNVSLDVVKSRRRHPTLHPAEVEHLAARDSSNPRFDEETHQRLYDAIGRLPMESAEVTRPAAHAKDKSFKARAESTTEASWGRRIRKIMFESRLVSYVEPIVVGRRRALPHLFGQAD